MDTNLLRRSSEPPGNHAPGKGIGKGMAIGAWLALGGILYLLFDDVVKDRINPNRNPESIASPGGGVEVILQRNRQNHYVTAGRINGKPVTFLLDTGATDVVVPETVASRIGLQPGRATRAHTANGTINVYATRLDKLSIGSLTLADVKGSINPHMQGENILLGMSVLGQVEIVQQGQELRLRTHGSGSR